MTDNVFKVYVTDKDEFLTSSSGRTIWANKGSAKNAALAAFNKRRYDINQGERIRSFNDQSIYVLHEFRLTFVKKVTK